MAVICRHRRGYQGTALRLYQCSAALTNGQTFANYASPRIRRHHKLVMAPKEGQSRRVYWNVGTDKKLQYYFDRREISTKLRTKAELEPINKIYFPEFIYKNFRANYLKKAALWEYNKEKAGKNVSSRERKRGKFLFYLFLQHSNF